MEKMVVIGGGGHAKVVIALLKKLGVYEILGYTDLKNNGSILGVSHLGTDSELQSISSATPGLKAAIGIGQVGLGKQRRSILERLAIPLAAFPPIVSAAAIVNESVSLGHGAVIMDGAVVNSGASIGCGAIVNTHSTIEHDSVVGDWAHIAPGAIVCGNVHIGDFSMIGAGATVIEQIRVASSCMVAAGATVIQTIASAGVYAGTPARLLHEGSQ